MKGRKLDSLGLSGAIVNLAFLGVETLGFIGLFIAGLVTIFTDPIGILMIFIAVVFGSLTIVATIFTARLLNGELKFKKLAYILGFVSLSVFGSILLVISKDELEVKKQEENLVDTISKFKALLDANAITEEEFSTLKNSLFK